VVDAVTFVVVPVVVLFAAVVVVVVDSFGVDFVVVVVIQGPDRHPVPQ
jgi:hypothetical protein